MDKPAITQISEQSRVLLQKDWLKTQFGEEDLADRLFTALSRASMKQYKFINSCIFYQRSLKIREILINLGLKPYGN